MIFNKNLKSADDLATSMQKSLNKTSSLDSKKVDVLLNDLNKSCELLEDLGNYKAAEIITKIIEKISG